MKKYFLLALTALLINASAKAAVGDTTWVQANNCQLSYYNNYDTAVTFPAPGTSYRKIYMIFSLGKYVCPAGSTYCGDWDYTVLNYLMTPGGDTLELARLITPYANAAAPRTPWSWVQNYVYDVTDYAPLLHDAATMRILFSGYSGGFTANVKFAFIEGTPDRDVKGIRRLWTGSYSYGDTTHLDSFNINTHFTGRTDTVPTGTVSTSMKFLVTGHGSDANGCCEFMSHNYQVLLNGTSVATKTIWRSDCGAAELYPQSGTWLYERANWCPGALVYANYHPLMGLSPGDTFNVALQFDPYVGSGGSYTTEGSLFFYGGMNKVVDASLDDVIAPTSDMNHFRENPTSTNPIVHVKNTGATTITSINFWYGIQGYTPQAYTWTGSLASLKDSDITLPLLSELDSLAGTSGNHTFICTIVSVNGSADNDASNNTITSSFVTAPVWPSPIKVVFKTNKAETFPGSGISETSWIIYDMNNSIVYQRAHAATNTLFRDTVYLPRGAYKMQVYDSSCDGLNWWAYAYYTVPPGSGSIAVYKLPNTLLPLAQDGMGGTYNNDFGCGFVQYFFIDSTVAPITLGVKSVNGANAAIDAYPNPAQGVVNIDITGVPNVHGKIQVIDMMGRVVSQAVCGDVHTQIDIEKLSAGLYTIVFVNDANGDKLLTKVVVAK